MDNHCKADTPIKLNLGCGSNYREGYINADRVCARVDLVFDLNMVPYPFPDDLADEVLLKQVLEHVWDVRVVLDELWRILKPTGSLMIFVPHFSHFQALTHPEHRHAFHYNSLVMFTPESVTTYTNCLWKIQKTHLHFRSALLEKFFNGHKYVYTTTILAYLFPAYQIEFVLHPLK
jgi:predicted SAM-dependent methyltransferase